MKTADSWYELACILPEEPIPSKKRKKHHISCGRCGRLMDLHGKNYICPHCKCKHGAHTDGKPLGIPSVDRETSEARIKAHQIFDRIWHTGIISRSQAYAILRRIMGMTIEEGHIARFNKAQCQFLIERLTSLGENVYHPPYNVSGFTRRST